MEEIKNTSENLEKKSSNTKQKRKTPYKRNYNKKKDSSGEKTKKENVKRENSKKENLKSYLLTV